MIPRVTLYSCLIFFRSEENNSFVVTTAAKTSKLTSLQCIKQSVAKHDGYNSTDSGHSTASQ